MSDDLPFEKKPNRKLFHSVFESVASHHSANIAVRFGDTRLTYEELNKRANSLACALSDVCSIHDEVVGVFLPSCSDYIISLLGISKAGGIVMPIDAAHPKERLKYVLQKGAPKVIVVNDAWESDLRSLLQECGLTSIECLNISHQTEAYPDHNQELTSEAEDSSYILFTSGSTGNPKAILGQHKSLSHFIHWEIKEFGLTSDCRVSQLAPNTFDVSLRDILVPLLSGGTLCIPSPEQRTNPRLLLQWMEDQELTLIHCVPSLFRLLCREIENSEDPSKRLSSLKHVLLAGEALYGSDVQKWHDLTEKRIELVNIYGPSETTLAKVFNRIQETPTHPNRIIPIGNPISNTAVLILKNERLCSIGEIGEIHIKTPFRSKGYYRDPELTAAAFIQNPLKPEDTTDIIYKTGDQGRYLPDRSIEFLGRLDSQIKINGIRLEIGELESNIRRCPSIEQSVVVPHQGSRHDYILSCYYIEKSPISGNELREFLRQWVPEEIIPVFFIRMDDFPLNLNGKVDRKALPKPEDLLYQETKYKAPTNALEEDIAKIWGEVLGIKQVGTDNSFIELGGDSLKAIRSISRIYQALGVEISLKDFFPHATVTKLAQIVAKQEKTIFSAIPAIPEAEHYPASHAQRRMWILNQMEENPAAYNISQSLKIEGQFDAGLFEQSLQNVIRKHESLRTTFIAVDGAPRQRIHKVIDFSIQQIDLSAESENSQLAKDLAVAEATAPFDLQTGPLLRVSVVKLGQADYVLLFCIHHIICDGWSIGVLVKEVMRNYNALVNGQHMEAETLAIHYKDFAEWQHHYHESEENHKDAVFWKEAFSGDLPSLQIPTDFQRPAITSFEGETAQITFEPELSNAIKRIAHQEGASLFMILTSLVKVLLHTYSRQEDIIAGTPIAGRSHPDLEDQIGLFVNTLALRTKLNHEDRFTDVLSHVKNFAQKAYEHQSYPFDRLVNDLALERDSSRSPLFDVLIVLQNNEVEPFKLDGATISDFSIDHDKAQFDLTFEFNESNGALNLNLNFKTKLYRAETIVRLIEQLQVLATEVTENPQMPIGRYSLLSNSEQARLDQLFKADKDGFETDELLTEAFERQVSQSPDSTAVSFESEKLTYAALNNRANQLARHLQASGVQPHDVVGLYLERSIEMVIGVIGILKAGATYLPLDPNAPEERLKLILEDAQVKALVTQKALQSPLISSDSITLVFLDLKESESLDGYGTENIEVPISSDAIAYIIYTSGSTGIPKGTLVSHRNVTRLFKATESSFGFNHQDKWTLFHSIAFDFSVWELWGALLYGGSLVVVPYWISRSPDAFHDLILEEKITILNQTPSAFYALMQAGEEKDEKLDTLRSVIFGGEALTLPRLKPWFDRYGDTKPQLVNMYGITETTVHVTWRPLSEKDLTITGSRIGSPLSDLRLYVVNPDMQRLPIGVPGELLVGGAGVSQGYLNREDLTQEKFIEDPFAPEKGQQASKLYRTGDLVRILAEGDIEYLGRIDQQVQIRGFRVELGEIESVLNKHPDIRQAVVVALGDLSEDKRLVAYYTAENPLSIEQLRTRIEEALPEYMMPGAFVQLDEIPLTANGKIDVKALPTPEYQSAAAEYVAPRNSSEELLVELWQKVLKIERISVTDNFFHLGGHSLLAMQLVSRIREAFVKEISLRQFFQHPVIKEQALLLSQEDASEKIIIPKADASKPLPLSYAQQRLWFIDQYQGSSANYNMPSALRFKGALNIPVLKGSLLRVIQRHQSLRTCFETIDGKATQTILNIDSFELPLIESGASQKSIDDLIFEEARKPFDLSSEIPIRARCIRCANDEHVVLLTMHHIASDGWSLGILTDEVNTIYSALIDKLEPELKPLEIQYVDFAAWQRSRLSGEERSDLLGWWVEELQDAPELLNLPLDKARPSEQTFNGEVLSAEISASLGKQLNALAAEEGVTPFILLETAFALLMHRYSQDESVVIGSPIANRNYEQIEPLIGFFVNTLALHHRFDHSQSFTELLQAGKDTILGAYDHQDLPFELLVDHLQTGRNVSHSPIFQVMFVLQNNPEEQISLPDLTVDFLPIASKHAKFDLTLIITETEGGLHCSWEYNTDLFEQATIERFSQHYQCLLNRIVQNPNEKIAVIDILPVGERKQIQEDWSTCETAYAEEKSVVHLIAEQATRSPKATALLFDGETMTYGELEARSNQLANYLRAQGLKREAFVGICVERSFDMVIALLGVMKAGGAYVPIDPEYPAERIEFILEDTQASLLITEKASAHEVTNHSIRKIYMDSGWGEIAEQPVAFEPEIEPKSLAYLIYTSGSTGRPKGVMIEHRGLTNLVHNVIEKFEVSEESCVLQFSSLSFDASVWEIFPTLSAGATLQLVKRETILDAESMQLELRQSRITHLLLTPSYLKYIPDDLTSLKAIMTAGEACNPDELKRWLGKVKVFNGYGPTEDTVCTTFYSYEKDTDVFSIGKPIGNKQVFILDNNLETVPVGIPGELCVGGHGLARGYLNRPEQTEEKFISNPFGTGRLYRTGDQVRWLPDGNIEFIGRIDNQVKIRGFRIELGEIENALQNHPDISQAVVLVETDDSGHKRLIAYFTEEKPTQIELLREDLKKRLPAHMIPAVFLQLDTMPITTNGKVDRKALPSAQVSGNREAHVAPRNDVERTLLDIWKEVLRNENIGITDNFFEVGGDSIIAIQLTSRISRAGYRLMVKELFVNPTVAESALCLATKSEQISVTVEGASELHPIQVHFFDNYTPVHHFNQSVILDLPPEVDGTVLEQSLSAVVGHHDVFRARFSQNDTGWTQIYNPERGQLKQLEIHDLSDCAESEREAKWEAFANRLQSSFKLGEGNLIRAALIHWDPAGGQRLFLCLHHLVIDGVSWRILLEDIQTAYRQISQGEALSLPAKTSSYQQWTNGLQEYAKSPQAQQQLSYWKTQLPADGYKLPCDHPITRNENAVSAAKSVSFELSPEQTDALLHEVHSSYHTQINDLLLTALSLTLKRWMEADSVYIELEGHGREDSINDLDLSRTVGWFTSLFPLRIELPDPDNLGDSLKQTKEQLRNVPEKGIGYGVLAHLSDAHETSLGYDSQHYVCFNYWGQLGEDTDESSWRFSSETTGENLHAELRRNNLLDVNCIISKGCFKASIGYAQNAFTESTASSLASSFQAHLSSLIEHCQNKTGGEHTPSDYPLAKGLTFEQLKTLEETYPQLEDIAPASPLQKGFYFHDFYDSDSSAYIVQVWPELEGDLDVPSFIQAWESVIARHSALRASFASLNDGELLQVFSKDNRLDHRILDWSELDTDTFEKQLDDLLAGDRKAGFALANDSLLRLHCIRKDVTRTVLVISSHHIILDGWSLPIIFREVIEGYKKIVRGESTHSSRIDRYQDYLGWIAQKEGGEAKQFWSNQLSGFESITPLPLLPANEIESSQTTVNRLPFELGEAATAKADKFCKSHQITANTLFQTTWACLLARLTNEDDIVFGATLSGRNIPISNVEEKVGLFINTVPVRIQWDAPASILDALKSTHENALKIQDHSYYPLFEIQNQSAFKTGEDLFKTLVVFENYPMDEQLLNEENDELRLLNVRSQEHTHYPLTLLINPGKNYRFELSYRDGLYDLETAERIGEYFKRLIYGILENPGQHFRDLPLLSSEEKGEILHKWNDTGAEYDRDKSLICLFAEHANSAPEAIALKQSGAMMSYGELHKRSNQIASYLIEQGIGKEDLVGILLDRSFEVLTSILGILKAGGAYLPLDPIYPLERLDYIAKHSEVKIIVTQKSLARLSDQLSSARQIFVEDIPEYFTPCELPEINGDSLAYVMYTSGSTGNPKGVEISHRAVARLVKNVDYVDISSDDVLSHMASIAFDASTFELWAPLLNGASLAIMPPGPFTLENIEEVIQSNNVSVVTLATELFHQVVDHKLSALKGVNQIIPGGDVLSVPHAKKAIRAFPKLRLINGYGPTENTTFTCCYTVPIDFEGTIPIGRPIANTTVYILDSHLQPQPLDVPGELYTGGDGLARGYHKRSDLTEEKFIDNPFGDGKLYATGDLACYRRDGNITFFGRIDQQVKIRGFRIELPEIEFTLSQHPTIDSSVVIAREIDGEKRILAYVIPREKHDIPERAELRNFLAARLPDYMIPSAFTPIDAYPVTPNGKLDRKALPMPDELGSKVEGSVSEPETPTEKAIAEIWSRVLNIEKISLEDSFYDMGGHSLKAMQVVTQIHKKLGKKIGLRDFFSHSTLAETAAFIDQLSQSRYDDIPIAPSMESYPLSYPQQRLWLLHNMGAHTAYNMPKAFLLEESINAPALNKAFMELVQRHEALRTSFVLLGGEPRQKIIATSEAAIREVDLSNESDPEASARKLAEEDAMTAFDLTRPPHLRMSLLHLGKERHIILLTMHHIIGDGWSMNVLYDEIIALYHAHLEQSPSPLKPLRIQYKDFAHWQKAIQFDTSETFWLEQITDMPDGLRLPYDLTPPRERGFRGSSCSIDFKPETTTALENLATAKKTTLSTVVLSLFKLFLFQLTRQKDFSVGVSIANRSHPDLENLIGFFVNVLPVRTQLTGDEDFDQLLDQVISTTENTYEHQDYPLDLLVQKHNPDRESNRQALFNIVYGFQNFGDLNIPIEQTDTSSSDTKTHLQSGIPFDLAFETSKFDLTLFAFVQNNSLRLVLEYDTELFKKSSVEGYLSTIKRFAELVAK